MALIILQPGETSSQGVGSGSFGDQVIGSTGNETVRIAYNGKVNLDPSFSAGGDQIIIDGPAGDFEASVAGSNLILTNDAGAEIIIPLGVAGVDIIFEDGTRELGIVAGKVELGDQVIPSNGTVVELDSGNRAPAFTDDQVTITVTEDGTFSDTLFGAAVDPDNDDLAFSLEDDALNGTATVNEDGTYTYTPNAGFVGNDQYVVSVTDGEFTDTLVVKVVVTAEGSAGVGETVRLSVGQDDIVVGSDDNDTTSQDDVIRARVAQNANGEQANQLGSGDAIDGGAGYDTLDAWVQDASPLNAGPASSILPETTDVERFDFRALSVAQTLSDAEIDDLPALFFGEMGPRIGVQINASDMFGAQEVGSVRSDDSLTIYNLTTLGDDGSTIRATGDITVRMDHTGNNNAIDLESDLTVLFDRDYLICEDDLPTGGQLFIEMMDLDAAILLKNGATVYPAGRSNAGETIEGPLDDSPYTQLNFFLGSEEFSLNIDTDYDNYAGLLAAVQAAIASQPALAGKIVASLGPDFNANDTDADPGTFATGRTIVLTNVADDRQFSDVTFDADFNGVPGEKDFHLQPYTEAPEGVECKIEVDIVLEKVGRGGDGGELTVGGMTPDLDNVWDKESEEGLPELPRGIEQFNISVEGTDDQDSSLAALRSTDNTLRCIIIADEGNNDADLVIGNRNTEYDGFDPLFADRFIEELGGFINFSLYEFLNSDGIIGQIIGEFVDLEDLITCDLSTEKNNALKDVLVFDASAFDNDTEIHAFFSDEVVDKYLNITDSEPTTGNPPPDHTTDNPDGDAVWTFGGGRNIVNVNIDKTNVAVEGAITREDFQFSVFTNGGEDLVQIQLGDGRAESGELPSPNGLLTENWYINHLLNQNLYINTGADNDKVETWGSTAANIVLGSGDDIAFIDNSGVVDLEDMLSGYDYNCGRAVWVFNSQNNDVDDLVSYGASNVTKAVNLTITVQYMDFLVTVPVSTTVGSTTGVTVTDLDIVQAIKNAINNDAVLSSFLIAEDGPARTLVVRSLTDGETVEADLTVTLGSSGALSSAQTPNGANLTEFSELSAAQLNALGFTATGQALAGSRFDADWGTQDSSDLEGFNSDNVNNDRVEGGTGDDDISLSTNEISINHVVISAPFGTDHILNFDTTGTPVNIAAVKEVQTLTFTGDSVNAYTVTIVLGNGEDVVVNIAAATPLASVASQVASDLTNDVGANVTATAAGGVVTITYDTPGNVGAATATITSSGTTETQAFDIAPGIIATAQTLTVNFGSQSFVIPVPAGTDQNALEQLIVTAVQNSTSTAVDATLGQPAAGPALVDGAFTLLYFGGTDAAQATFTYSGVGGLAITSDAGNSTAFSFTPGTTVTAAATTTIEGVAGLTVNLGADIFDVSAIIGPGGPGYFDNDQQTDNIEGVSIDGLIDSGKNGVILIDGVESGDPGATGATELARVQSLVTAADNAGQSGTNTSIIITVEQNPGNLPSPADTDGTWGKFYKVVDGSAAGDAKVEYLGTVYLGGSDGENITGNYDAMTAYNFTPLTPTELQLGYGGLIV